MIESFEAGDLLKAQPRAKPNPKILVQQNLPDGQDVIAVWAHLRSIRSAKLVTVYFERRR
jgi:hypothetical protein